MVNISSFIGGATGGAAVNIVINAIDNFSDTFNKAGKSVNKFSQLSKVALTTIGTGLAALTIASIKSSAELKPIEEGFKRLTNNSEDFLLQLKRVTDGTISNFELMSRANQALLLGIEQNKLPDLF